MGGVKSKQKSKQYLQAQIVLDPFDNRPVEDSQRQSETLPQENQKEEVKMINEIKLKKGELIGKGSFGNVYKCLDESNGRLIVMKEILIEKKDRKEEEIRKQIQNMKQEIYILKQVKHPNIVQYIGTNLLGDLEGAGIIEEYVSGGSLRQLISQFGKLHEQICRVYLRQICSGLAYLHSQQILHRDLKCANILLDAQGVIKIGDLGSSIKLDAANYVATKQLVGSLYWLPPETALNIAYSTKSDIWSLGCLLLEMLEGRPPLSNLCQKEILLNLARGEIPTLSGEVKTSLECQAFLQDCLQFQPEKRLSAESLLNHPFLCQPDNSGIEKSISDGTQVNSIHNNWHSVYYSGK